MTLPSGKREIRRWSSMADGGGEVLQPLLNFLHNTYSKFYTPPLRFSLSFDDGDDVCSIDTEAEIQEAINIQRAQQTNTNAIPVLKVLATLEQGVKEPASAVLSPASISGFSTPMSGHGQIDGPPSPSLLHGPPSPSMHGSGISSRVEEDENENENEAIDMKQQPGANEKEEDEERELAIAATRLAMNDDRSSSSPAVVIENGDYSSDDEYIRIDADGEGHSQGHSDGTSSAPASSQASSLSASQALRADLCTQESQSSSVSVSASSSQMMMQSQEEHKAEVNEEPVEQNKPEKVRAVEIESEKDENENEKRVTSPPLASPTTPLLMPPSFLSAPPLIDTVSIRGHSLSILSPSSIALYPLSSSSSASASASSASSSTSTQTQTEQPEVAMTQQSNALTQTANATCESAATQTESRIDTEAEEAQRAATEPRRTVDIEDVTGICDDLPEHEQSPSVPYTGEEDEPLQELSEMLPKTTPVTASSTSSPSSSSSSSASSSSSSVSLSSASSSSSESGEAVVHRGIICDGCGMRPIVGIRYHCTTCNVPGGYDMCERCDTAGDKHPNSHLMLKMRVPAHVPVGGVVHQAARRCPFTRSTRDIPRPSAAFVRDLTFPAGSTVRAGATVRKVWSLRNTGDQSWPRGTHLIFTGGDLMPESAGRMNPQVALVPTAEPNEIVHISVDILVPNELGRFRATFRLATAEGIRFGPRIWIDLRVPEEQEEEEENEQKQQEEDAQQQQEEVHEEVERAEEEEEEKQHEQEPQQEQQPQVSAPIPEPVQEEPVVAVPAPEAVPIQEQPVAAPVAQPSVPAAPSAPRFQYSNQMATLRSMGFTSSPEIYRYLLLNNNGDVQKVVDHLLTHPQQQ